MTSPSSLSSLEAINCLMRAIEIYTDMVRVACWSCLTHCPTLFVLCCRRQGICRRAGLQNGVSAVADTEPPICCLCPLDHPLSMQVHPLA